MCSKFVDGVEQDNSTTGRLGSALKRKDCGKPADSGDKTETMLKVTATFE
jgi:hypothetical protein